MKASEERAAVGWTARRVLVTGCTGFLGSTLSRALAQRGAALCGLSPSAGAGGHAAEDGDRSIVLVSGTVQDEASVERVLAQHRPQVVFHLAAAARANDASASPAHTFDTNVRGTWTVLEACRKAGCVDAVLVASSAAVYGPAERARVETDALGGQGLYEVSKACADALARAYERTHGLPVVVVRSVNLYGPGDLDWNRLVPGTIRSVWSGDKPVLRSDGSPRAEYLHVEDAIAGWLALASAMHDGRVRGAFNLGTGMAFSVLEVVREVLEVMGSEHLEPRLEGRGGAGPDDRLVDSGLMRKQLGWEPRRTLREGLVDTVAWYTRYLQGQLPRAGDSRPG